MAMQSRKKILIAYDGSGGARQALEDLKRAGLPREAEAVTLSVAEMWLAPISALEVAAGTEPMALAERIDNKRTLALRAADGFIQNPARNLTVGRVHNLAKYARGFPRLLGLIIDVVSCSTLRRQK
jgi:hypothetical protein